MKNWTEMIGYIAISSGMALAISCFSMIALIIDQIGGVIIALAIIIAGLCISVVVSAVSELTGMFPSSPGIRSYISNAFGNTLSLIIVYMYLTLVVFIAGVEGYLVYQMTSDLQVSSYTREFAVYALFTAIGVINLFGLEVSKKIQICLTSILFTSLIILSVSAVIMLPNVEHYPAEMLSATLSSDFISSSFVTAVGMAIFLFVGFEWVTLSASHPTAYKRKIPIAMFTSVALLGALYIALSLIIQRKIGSSNNLSAYSLLPHIMLGAKVFGTNGYTIMVVLSILAMLTSFNVGLMAASKLVFSLARERYLPRWLRSISLDSGAPIGAILALWILSVTSATIVIHFEMYQQAINIGAAIAATVYVSFIAAKIKLRASMPEHTRPYKSKIPLAIDIATAVFFITLILALLLGDGDFAAIGIIICLFLASLILSMLGKNNAQKYLTE